MIRYVPQPDKSRQCGQACIAMVCNISLEEAIELCGTSGGTKTRQLVHALERKGRRTTPRLRIGRPAEGLAIVRFNLPRTRNWHWSVWFEGRYYDPDHGVFPFVPKPYYQQTSYLPVELPS